MHAKTVDLCDAYPDRIAVAAPIFQNFGGLVAFSGSIATIKVHEDNVLVAETLEQPGDGRVLVVDGGGSLRCALVGGRLAALAERNGWNGIVVNGCIRDTIEIRATRIGVKALAAHPMKSGKNGAGQRDVYAQFAGITFAPAAYLYADEDGLIMSPFALALPVTK